MIFLKIIGLCGGSGTGKGYVARMFSERGFAHIDTDAVYHNLVSGKSECLSELVDAFGGGILRPDGTLDRAALASVAFSTPERHKLLNTITHKHVLSRVRKIIAQLDAEGTQAVLVDAPMLFESGFDKECDLILGVVAPIEVRISRIMSRDGISRERAVARIGVQLSSEEIAKRCDYLINNGGDVDISSAVAELCNILLN